MTVYPCALFPVCVCVPVLPSAEMILDVTVAMLFFLGDDFVRVVIDQFCSLVAEDGGSDVEGASGLPVAAACEASASGTGPSSASKKVFFTPCQKLLVKSSFISVLAHPSSHGYRSCSRWTKASTRQTRFPQGSSTVQ